MVDSMASTQSNYSKQVLSNTDDGNDEVRYYPQTIYTKSTP
jgi:hypothetical protein